MTQAIRHYPRSYLLSAGVVLLALLLFTAEKSSHGTDDIDQRTDKIDPEQTASLRPIITIPPSLQAFRNRMLADRNKH